MEEFICINKKCNFDEVVELEGNTQGSWETFDSSTGRCPECGDLMMPAFIYKQKEGRG